jgi:hypothetical protein
MYILFCFYSIITFTKILYKNLCRLIKTSKHILFRVDSCASVAVFDCFIIDGAILVFLDVDFCVLHLPV